MGPLHSYGLARCIEHVRGDEAQLNQGTIYASLFRLQQRGWIIAKWGESETGRKQLNVETANWQRLAPLSRGGK